MKDELKTKDSIDNEGWLHSGDIGKIDKNGMVSITGRLKELIIGAGGENIAPVPIEEKIKKNLPAVSNLMMVGDKRKYNVMLVTLKSVLDSNGNPTDDLTGDALDVNKDVKTVSGAVVDSVWDKYIEKGIKT